MTDDYQEILSLLDKYFDLLYDGDATLIPEVFLPEAHVYSVVDGQVVVVDVEGFRERIEARPAPSRTGEERRDRIIAIDRLGPSIALAKVDLLILPAGYYADYLSMLKVAGNWRIASKVFHHSPA